MRETQPNRRPSVSPGAAELRWRSELSKANRRGGRVAPIEIATSTSLKIFQGLASMKKSIANSHSRGGGVIPSYDMPTVELMARFAVEELNKEQDSNLEFVRVIHASQGLVSGTIYYLIIEVGDSLSVKKVYRTQVVDIPWLNRRYLKESIHLDDLQVAVVSPPDDVQSETHFSEALLAVKLHNEHHNTKLVLVNVVHAEEGTLSGISYFLTIEVMDSDSGNNELYEFQLWRAPWDKIKLKLLDKSNHIHDDLAGIGKKQRVVEKLERLGDDKRAEFLARFAVKEHNKIQNSNLEFVRVIHASQASSSVTLYHLIIEVLDSSFSVKRVYNTQVLDNTRLNILSLVKFIHLDDLKLAVVSRPGCNLQSNTHFFEALLAVKLHNKNNNTILDLVKVVHAEVGTITGIRYFLTIEAANSDCTGNKKLYEFQLWRAPWDARKLLLHKPNPST